MFNCSFKNLTQNKSNWFNTTQCVWNISRWISIQKYNIKFVSSYWFYWFFQRLCPFKDLSAQRNFTRNWLQLPLAQTNWMPSWVDGGFWLVRANGCCQHSHVKLRRGQSLWDVIWNSYWWMSKINAHHLSSRLKIGILSINFFKTIHRKKR